MFKLTRSGDNWTYTDLHDFSDGTDGGLVTAGVTLDANGNIYGTAVEGGGTVAPAPGCGGVWEIMQQKAVVKPVSRLMFGSLAALETCMTR